jgi:cytochrome c553
MKFLPTFILSVASTLAAVGIGQAVAQTIKPDAAKGQTIAANVCAACHMADGNSAGAPNPKLAGQHADYLVKQLREYKSKKRDNAVMAGMATPLSEADMQNVAAYFATQKSKPNFGKTPATRDLGQKIYRAGIAEKGVPACAGCHGASGAGMPAQYPRLAGQHAAYTLEELKDFAEGKRANDANSMMRTVAAKMNEKEMSAVAEYIAGMR